MLTDVHLIPVFDRWLVLAPLARTAAVVNESAARRLRRGEALTEGGLGELTAALTGAGAPPPLASGPAQPPFLGLILTRGCNQECRYCDFGAAPTAEAMTSELVSEALGGWVEWVRDTGGETLELHFFGGEPFTQPDLIELAVHRTRYLAQESGLRARFEASTNGLLGAGILEFTRRHFDAIVLSLDGQAPEHDRHRPGCGGVGSFAAVWRTAQALADSSVELCIRCCVSTTNVDAMAVFASWLVDEIQPASLTFEPLKPTPAAAAAGLVPPEPLAFVRGFIAARRAVRARGVECVYGALLDEPRHTSCPLGRDTFIVAPDRTIRSCYLRARDWMAQGLDLRLGRVEEGGPLRIDTTAVTRLRALVANRARCRNCFCRWSCAGGCLVTETPPGHGLEHTAYCRQTRLLQACVLLDDLALADLTDALLADPAAAARLWTGGEV